jgi:membrane protein involved in colicin uptake
MKAEALRLPFTLTGGVMRFASTGIKDENAELSGDARVDLIGLRLQSDWRLAFEPGVEAIAGGDPSVVFALGGLLVDPAVSIDAGQITNYLSMRAFERERRKVELLQAGVVEKQRLRREIALLNERAAQREAAEAARVAAQEAARLAAEEAARVAEDEAARQAEEQAQRALEEKAAAQRAAEEAARLAAEEQKRLAEEQAQRAREEKAAARRAAEEAARLAVEEQKRQAEEQAQRAREEKAAARRAAEEAARLAAEEQKRLAEEQAQRVRDEKAAAQRAAEEAARQNALDAADAVERRPLPDPLANPPSSIADETPLQGLPELRFDALPSVDDQIRSLIAPDG